MNELELIRASLAQLLGARSPELGARLKQRLIALLSQQNKPIFDERKLGYKGFRAFLEATQSDWLEIGKHESSGDISVSPRQSPPIVSPKEVAPPQHPVIAPVRSDIWQAFTNPDPNRKRFFNADTGEVLHYSEGESSSHEQHVRASTSQFIEIPPIEASSHQKWMRDFLDSIPITGSERVPYDAILNQQYSSALNATFTRALGDHAHGWREQRTQRILNVVARWAADHRIAEERLRAEVKKSEFEIPRRSGAPNSDREKALKLLDLVGDEEISRVVLPILLATLMVKAHR